MDVYTDGSYNKDNGKSSGAFILVENNEIIYDSSFIVFDNGKHNVRGELEAVLRALKYCEKQNLKEINLFYDYIGIEKWLTKQWKIKDTLVHNFVNQVKKTNIKINFRKVKSHSDDKFNDIVDTLCTDLTFGCKEVLT